MCLLIYTQHEEDDADTHKRLQQQLIKQVQAVNFRLHWLRYCEGKEYSAYYILFSVLPKSWEKSSK